MRSPLLAAILVFYSFSAVAQQTGSAVPPPFQAKRLPPEKTVSVDSSELATQLSRFAGCPSTNCRTCRNSCYIGNIGAAWV